MLVNILSEVSAVKQVIIHLMMNHTPFEIKFKGNETTLSIEKEDDLPEVVKQYVLQAKGVTGNGKK